MRRAADRTDSTILPDRLTSLRGAQPVHVLLVAPVAPPYGGMQLQAELVARLLRGDGVRVTSVASNPPFPRRLQFLESVRGVRPFARAVVLCINLWPKLAAADVVHVMAASWLYFFLVVCPAICASRFRNKRVIVNYRGGEADRFLSSWGWLARPVFRFANLVTAPSAFLKEILETHTGIPVTVVPNVVDLSAFKFRERRTLAPKLLVTRHLEQMYDVASVLKAFAYLQEQYLDASLWIAGTGEQETHLRSLASLLNVRNVRFLGHVAHEDLPAIYDQCDIYINASLVDNFPGALLEASASGLVVVTTRAGGIPFIYEHHKNALLVDLGDYQGLAQGVDLVLRDPSLTRVLAAAGLALVQRFQWETVGKALRETYRLPVNPVDSAAKAPAPLR